jgi:hypothetical protein
MITKQNFPLLVILFLLPFTAIAQPNVKPDNKIGKRELEFSFIAGLSDRGGLAGSQLIYRFPLGCKFKLGGGFHFSVDENKGGTHPAGFIELSKFVGNKQKWKFSGQVGRGFYETSYRYNGINGASYSTKESREIFYQFNSVYRMNISRKLLLFAGPYFLLQSYKLNTEVNDVLGQPLNPFSGKRTDSGGGIRFGIVF